jgi:hypothetical protein
MRSSTSEMHGNDNYGIVLYDSNSQTMIPRILFAISHEDDYFEDDKKGRREPSALSTDMEAKTKKEFDMIKGPAF